MRLTYLCLVLGTVVGFAAHSFVTQHPGWFRSTPKIDPTGQAVVAAKPSTLPEPIYRPVDKVLTDLRKYYAEAVVVVVADESYDEHYMMTRVTVREVWKGPDSLVGQTMSSKLQAPLSYQHSKSTERVLVFMPMTPCLDTKTTIFFTGDSLRMNPAIGLTSLRDYLTKHSEVPGVRVASN